MEESVEKVKKSSTEQLKRKLLRYEDLDPAVITKASREEILNWVLQVKGLTKGITPLTLPKKAVAQEIKSIAPDPMQMMIMMQQMMKEERELIRAREKDKQEKEELERQQLRLDEKERREREEQDRQQRKIEENEKREKEEQERQLTRSMENERWKEEMELKRKKLDEQIRIEDLKARQIQRDKEEAVEREENRKLAELEKEASKKAYEVATELVDHRTRRLWDNLRTEEVRVIFDWSASDHSYRS